jgi:uncharacterized membrane protein
MGKTARRLIILVSVAAAAVLVYRFYQGRRVQQAGIISESIEHQGGAWTVDYTARIPAPAKAVFGAIEHIEDSHADSIRSVKVLSEKGNRKVVELTMNGPANQSVVTKIAFEYFPEDDRITYRTLDSPMLDTNAEYKLTDEGASTLITFHQTATSSKPINLPEAIVKEVIRSVFIGQLDGIKRSLNITTPAVDDEADKDPDEP